MVAMSGAIMPAPLAMPLIGDDRIAERREGGGDLGIGVGGHDRLGGVHQPVLPRSGGKLGKDVGDPCPVERLADHAGRGHEHFTRQAADRLGRGVGDERDGLDPLLAGEGVGVAGIDDQRPRLAARELLAAPVDRRGRALRPGEHAGDLGRLIEHRHHHVGAPLVAHARRDGGEADAGDRRQGRIFLRRERGERGGSGHESVIQIGRRERASRPLRG